MIEEQTQTLGEIMTKDTAENYYKGLALQKSASRWMTAYWITLFAAIILLAVGHVLTESPVVVVIYAIMMVTSVGFFVRSVILSHRYDDLQRKIWRGMDARVSAYLREQGK